MSDEYLRIQVGEGYAYVRTCCLNRLRDVDAAIFDCDGVLIDTRESYRKSIVETIKYFISELTDVMLPSDNALKEIMHILKSSGGFNNDWDATYAILLFLFSKMPESFRKEFISLMNSKFPQKTLRERFDYVKTSIKSKPVRFTISLDQLTIDLKRFVQMTDDSGITSVEREFINSGDKEIFFATKRFLNYPNHERESLLATVFDEMFYGSELFEEIYKRKRQFYNGVGFVDIERGKTLVSGEVLEELALVIGRENFGIVSGRDRLSARFSLGKILDKFKSESVIFLMDSNYPNKQDEEERAKLKKPNPYPLIKASRGLAPFKYSLYVGDSAEDIIMVKRANELDYRFISVGVYSLSDFKDELVSYFLKTNTDLIVNSINELPYIIGKIKVKNYESRGMLKRNQGN